MGSAQEQRMASASGVSPCGKHSGVRVAARSTALTKPALYRSGDALTCRTASLMAADAGMRFRNCS